jgi:pyridoxamine 5'-phosphate oxidase family protein
MTTLNEKEIAYLSEPRLGRLATVGRDGQPHVVPVIYRFTPETNSFDIGGYDFKETKKYRDVVATGKAALAVDDDTEIDRGVVVRGDAEAHESGGERLGEGFDSAWIRITPRRVISWGLDEI